MSGIKKLFGRHDARAVSKSEKGVSKSSSKTRGRVRDAETPARCTEPPASSQKAARGSDVLLSRIDQLQYTKEYVAPLVHTVKLSKFEKFLTNVQAFEKKLSTLENVTVKSLLEDVLIDLMMTLRDEPMTSFKKKVIDPLSKAMKAVGEGVNSVSQVRVMLSNNGLNCEISQRSIVRRQVHILKDIADSLPQDLKTKEDVDVCNHFKKDLDRVCEDIELNPELTCLEKYVTELKEKRASLESKLKALEGELKTHYDHVKRQTVCVNTGGAYVRYSPSSNHPSVNEDCFKHDQYATVVADGIGSDVCSEGAAQLVVQKLHDKMSDLARTKEGAEVNREDVYVGMLSVCKQVVQEMEKSLDNFTTGAAAAVELRIHDDKGDMHRFLLFVGDCNAVLTREGAEPIYLNPTEYKVFERKLSANAYTKQSSGVANGFVPCLSVKDVERLKRESKSKGRDVTCLRACFSNNSDSPYQSGDAIAIVYVAPNEAKTTALMSDGISDRCPAEKVSPESIEKVITVESYVHHYECSPQFVDDFNQADRLLAEITSSDEVKNKEVRKSERAAIQPFKLAARGWSYESEDTKKKIKEDIIQLLDALKWPTTDYVVEKVEDFVCSWQYGEYTMRTKAYAQEDLSRIIAYEQFKLSELGYADVCKWRDDVAYVDTAAPPCEMAGLTNKRSLPLLVDEFKNLTGESTEDDVVSLLRRISEEYTNAMKQISEGHKGAPDFNLKIKSFVRKGIATVANRERVSVHPVVHKAIKGEYGLELQDFLVDYIDIVDFFGQKMISDDGKRNVERS